jgi:CTP:molybdopterin cytidylyltransferase MocA
MYKNMPHNKYIFHNNSFARIEKGGNIMGENAVSTGYGCVILAAGLGRRFGGGKLFAEFDGIPLYKRAFSAVPQALFRDTVVVSAEREILVEAETMGFRPVRNPRPEDGISLSIRLGLEALGDCEGALFMVGDQPLLRRETVSALMAAARENPGCILAPVRQDGSPGNPCYFPARFFPELMALTGDTGGRRVIRTHPEALRTLAVDERELTDTDSPEALSALSGHL